MLKTTKTFKKKMKVYGKQLNILLGFGHTKLDKTHVKKLNLSVNGDLFTSVMRQVELEIENYTTIDKSKIMTVREVHEATVRRVDRTQVKYLAEDQNKEYTVEDVHNMSVGKMDNTRIKFLIPHDKRENIETAATINIQLGVRTSEFDNYEYIDWGEFVVYDKRFCQKYEVWKKEPSIEDIKDGKHIGSSALQGRQVGGLMVTNALGVQIKKVQRG